MILRKLYDLYDRLAEDPAYDLPRIGYSKQNISMEVVFKQDGTLESMNDIRYTEKYFNQKGREVESSPKAKSLLVIGGAKPPGNGLNPCFLWDNTSYALGVDSKKSEKTPEKIKACFKAFKELHLSREKEIPCPEYASFCRWLERWDPDDPENQPFVEVIHKIGTNGVVFRLLGHTQYLHEEKIIKDWWDVKTISDSSDPERGICLITGEEAPIARLHEPDIRGVHGAQAKGAKIVSFNCKSFVSYGKEQGSNAPVSKIASFKYNNALNILLASKDHVVHMDNMALVFWAEKPNAIEQCTVSLLVPQFDFEEEQNKEGEIRKYLLNLKNARKTNLENNENDIPFYILGLSPNNSRLSIRLWCSSTVGQLGDRLSQFIKETEIVKSNADMSMLTLKSIAREIKNFSPILEGSLVRSVFTGSNYPTNLVTSILQDIKVKPEVLHFSAKASLLKAFLMRNYKHTSLTMSLDLNNTNVAYLLGRLLATLEKIQEDALKKVNASICDKYYAAASKTPRTVFSRLLANSKNHLRILEEGKKNYWEKYIGFILNNISSEQGLPAHLSLEDQSFFALGYYQQRQYFYTPNKDKNVD